MSSMCRIAIDVNVTDREALWSVVSERLANVYGLSADEIVDSIGPREDPEIEQCMTMLLDPSRWNGCVVESFECASLRSGVSTLRGAGRSLARPLISRVGEAPMPGQPSRIGAR